MSEVWLSVCGYEGLYEVSDQGRVRALPRTITTLRSGRPFTQTKKAKVLKSSFDQSGHLHIRLAAVGGFRRPFLVHRMVLMAFVGPCPDGMEGCHNDGDPTNNWLSNLRWDTRSANQRDAVRHGAHNNTKKTHCPANHAYNEANTYISPDGRRNCRACGYEHGARYRAKIRANRPTQGAPA